ncbi:hypothetical protein K525DRAFT_244535 [Schizophyllum commune Loenen D]|nr:hypothetical protein K525DRAFT_244535 [Schizophyllum commune Loenen D]
MHAIQTATRASARTVFRAAATRSGAVGVRYSSTSTMHDNDPKTLELEKQRNLAGKQHHSASAPHEEHAPGWNEHLASASEASVKADQAPHGDPAEMQRKTIDGIKRRHMHDDSSEPTTASFSRDSVEGPLSEGGAKEFVKKTVHEETTEVVKDKNFNPTMAEEFVKADRGDL